MTRINLLGAVRVLVDGKPIEGDAAQRRRLALLALLATPPLRAHPRDRLVATLWPENDTESARHLLSASIHVIRKALGSDALITDGDTVALSPSVSVDVVEFRKALVSGDVDAAINEYQGSFLDGFYIKDAPEFEQWCDGERAEMSRLFADALRANAGDNVERWRRLLALDPFDKRNVIGVMDALVAAGNRAGALQHARMHAELLKKEFDAAPDDEVEARAASIRASGDAGAVTGQRTRVSSVKAPRSLIPIAAAAAFLLLFGYWSQRDSDLTHVKTGEATVAVLPFHNITRDTAASYFADGMTEQILDVLSRMNGVDVVPMSSTSMFRDSVTDPATIAAKLHAGYLLVGSLQKAGDNIRVWVRLLRAADGRAQWSDSYDVKLGDIFGMQDTIALKVAHGMRLTMKPDGVPTTTARSMSLNAYSLYTMGSAQLQKRTPESLQAALSNFKQAAALDTSYALAYAGIADSYNMLGSYDYSGLDPGYAYPRARTAAERALRLNPDLDRAHAALATTYANYYWRVSDATKEFEKAIQLNNRNSAARQWYALMLSAQGKLQAAREQTAISTRIDPASPVAFVNRAHVLYYAGQFDSAAVMLDRALSVDPTFSRAHVLYTVVDLHRGREKQAIARLQQLLARSNEPVLVAILTYALGKVGKLDEARTYAAELEELAASHYVPPELRALAAVGVNDREGAFTHLEEATRRRSGGVPYLAVEPMMRSLKNDPRFARLVAATRS